MPGDIIGDLDVAQLMVILFFLFFFGLVLYLRQEDKREGYPLKDPADGRDSEGFPPIPSPKTFRLMDGGMTTAPRKEAPEPLSARLLHPFPGSPLDPVGDPFKDGQGLGPAAFALRKTRPMIYDVDAIQVLPMRTLEGWSVGRGDPDPRGMTVLGADGVEAGVVEDLWIDRSVKILRYLEVRLSLPAGEERVLLPIYHSDIRAKARRIRVSALRAFEFERVPRLEDPDQITSREEDQVNAFYAGGRFYRELEGRRAP